MTRRAWLWLAAVVVAIVGIWLIGYAIFWVGGETPGSGEGEPIPTQTTPG